MAKHSLSPATGPRRAAIYLRVSSVGQEQDGTSLDTQEERDRAHAAAQGYAVDEGHVYREVYSGVELWERPKLTALREAIRHRAIDVVIVYAIDRLARDPVHLGVILSEAEHAGVAVDFVTEPLDYSPEGQLIRFVRGYAAKVEHEKIKERTWRGKLAKLQDGKHLPGRCPPYGYRWVDAAKTRLEFDPVTSPIMWRIFDSVVTGTSLRGLAAMLTAEGIPTPAGGCGPWYTTTLRRLLGNPIYWGAPAGLRWKSVKKNGKTHMVARPESEQVSLAPDLAPPLVEPGIAAIVQQRIQHNRVTSPRHNSDPEATLLRGGYARCGYCGGTMVAARHPRAGWRYTCGRGTVIKGACHRFGISAPNLDAAVWNHLERLLTQPETIAAELAQLQNDDPTAHDLTAIERQLAEVTRRQGNLARQLGQLCDDAAEPVVVELNALAARKQQLSQEHERVLARRASWEAAQGQLKELAAWCQDVGANLKTLSYRERRLALEALGVRAQVWQQGHTPRYQIEARIPLTRRSTPSPHAPIVNPSSRPWTSLAPR
jgi:site-specific DNA recombinase